ADEPRVDLHDARRRPHVELLHARVDRDAASDQRRAHPAVGEQRALGQERSVRVAAHRVQCPTAQVAGTTSTSWVISTTGRSVAAGAQYFDSDTRIAFA